MFVVLFNGFMASLQIFSYFEASESRFIIKSNSVKACHGAVVNTVSEISIRDRFIGIALLGSPLNKIDNSR